MGEWSEAVNDGVVCKHCHLPLGGEPTGTPTLCENCEREEKGKGEGGKLGPGWLPPR